ncbi:MAG: ATP-binding cassette domain-containing protein [Planctomycetes bacterium]|nr:ATP-binding cassette domain-containing protein [Planctomycetota bacterium]
MIAGLARLALLELLAHAAWLAAWWWLGRAALSGRLELEWLLASALPFAAWFLLHAEAGRCAGVLAVATGRSLRRGALEGALRLTAEEVRGRGLGAFLGQTLDIEGIERALADGGGALLSGAIGLALALGTALLLPGAGGLVAALLLGVALAAWLVRRLFAARRRASARRLELTDRLIERMAGQRTRLVQEEPARRHEAEDRALAAALMEQQVEERRRLALETLLARGWQLVAFAALLPAFATHRLEGDRFAAAVGLVLFAAQSLQAATRGAASAVTALDAWRRIAPLVEAGRRPIRSGDARIAARRPAAEERAPPVVEARALQFAHSRRAAPVLRDVDLVVRRGERLLLEGASGGGKSTLAGVLAGLREPTSGVLLADGVDRAALGDREWRRRIALVPQFHENHVLQAPLLFNALMGRAWPPSDGDLAACEELLAELGLGDVIARMPGGLGQLVGECGWQLSHGEQARLHLARALLQEPAALLIDESFAALDPATLRKVLAVVRRRAPTLLVIAHA